jgi:hypothetical protein
MVRDSTIRWHFTRESGDRWQWQRITPDGSVENASDPQNGIGPAMSHAVRHGFNPSRDHWIISDNVSTTHYRPGAAPTNHCAPRHERHRNALPQAI